MVASKDISLVRNEIRSTYGFEVTDQFAGDFIAFVDKAVKGEFSE